MAKQNAGEAWKVWRGLLPPRLGLPVAVTFTGGRVAAYRRLLWRAVLANSRLSMGVTLPTPQRRPSTITCSLGRPQAQPEGASSRSALASLTPGQAALKSMRKAWPLPSRTAMAVGVSCSTWRTSRASRQCGAGAMRSAADGADGAWARAARGKALASASGSNRIMLFILPSLRL
ncbi:hypothetical protein AA979_07410 [Stenotrophomonas maltophilia]|nr:hypothetical protein AA979_07410 [Stenotrophomonas maltophilia]